MIDVNLIAVVPLPPFKMEWDDITALGDSLRPINPKILKQDNNFERIWYQGGEPYFDVFLDLQNNEIVWFQFTLRGKALFWAKENPTLQTGKTAELESDDMIYYSASKLIKTDSKLDLQFINFARYILETRSGEPLFDKALALFKGY